ncbi:hypothetical protein A8F94_03575 [Bacillus sp. FJAT-27225]|uniref:LysM peptidoglycan-binding domain-containing protein n=1 Tax=Bacillus sp. FJAT-27225 TaxID=1743144 RepID=UPI00080C2658|nr:LysM peptidoglycan-binding domain-containing protein [Bacillus sp. FJAT-27225]OCA90962.1 hypothetical protein A8F94_03575 [Bacillus sp. FJAT-27225]
MNKEDPYRKQAEKNRRRIVIAKPDPNDVSSLPPRSRVHQEKKKKTVLKLKYPVIRLLVLFFILLPITVLSVISNMEENKSELSARSGYEEVSLEEKDREIASGEENGADKSIATATREDETAERSNGDAKQTLQSSSPDKPATEGKDSQVSPVISPANTKQQQGNSAAKTSEMANKQTGQETTEPEGTQTESSGSEESKPVTSNKILYHTVKPGETLFRIAMTYYKNQAGIDTIRKANGLVGNEIETGQTLKIPVN